MLHQAYRLTQTLEQELVTLSVGDGARERVDRERVDRVSQGLRQLQGIEEQIRSRVIPFLA